MGLTSFSIANLLFSFEAKDDLKSVFDLDTFSDRMFLITTAISVTAIVLGTELPLFERFLKTEHLDGRQWLLCMAVALPVLIVAEVKKLIARRALAA